MKATDLLRFINNNDVEYHWLKDDKDVILCVMNYQIQAFYSLLDATIFDDEGIKCIMRDGYFVFDMMQICDYYDINIEDVFEKIK